MSITVRTATPTVIHSPSSSPSSSSPAFPSIKQLSPKPQNQLLLKEDQEQEQDSLVGSLPQSQVQSHLLLLHRTSKENIMPRPRPRPRSGSVLGSEKGLKADGSAGNGISKSASRRSSSQSRSQPRSVVVVSSTSTSGGTNDATKGRQEQSRKKRKLEPYVLVPTLAKRQMHRTSKENITPRPRSGSIPGSEKGLKGDGSAADGISKKSVPGTAAVARREVGLGQSEGLAGAVGGLGGVDHDHEFSYEGLEGLDDCEIGDDGVVETEDARTRPYHRAQSNSTAGTEEKEKGKRYREGREDKDQDQEEEHEGEHRQHQYRGPIRHVYIHPPPSYTSSYLSPRERLILERALLLASGEQESRSGVGVGVGAGRYNPPAKWEDLCRTRGVRERGPNATRNESRAQRYSEILEGAYGEGDVWRGHWRKPARVVLPSQIQVPQTQTQTQTQTQVKGKAITVDLTVEETESEAESEDDMESLVAIPLVGSAVDSRPPIPISQARARAKANENETESSDAYSTDPPITPPDDPLLSVLGAVTVADSKTTTIPGSESALKAPIVVNDNTGGGELTGSALLDSAPLLQSSAPPKPVPGRPTPRPFGTNDPARKPVRPENISASASLPAVLASPSPSVPGNVGAPQANSALSAGIVRARALGASSSGTAPLRDSMNSPATIPERRNSNKANGVSSSSGGGTNATLTLTLVFPSSDSESSRHDDTSPPLKTHSEAPMLVVDPNPKSSTDASSSGVKLPVHQIRWYNTEEWKGVFRRVVSGKRMVSNEDLVRVHETMASIEGLIKGMVPGDAQAPVEIVKEYLILMKDLPDGFIPYNDHFGLRKRSAEMLRATYGVA